MPNVSAIPYYLIKQSLKESIGLRNRRLPVRIRLGVFRKGGSWDFPLWVPALPVALVDLTRSNLTAIIWGMSTMLGKFLSVKEAAKILGCTDGRVRQLVLSGVLKYERFNGRALAIPLESLQKYAKTPIKTGRPRQHPAG